MMLRRLQELLFPPKCILCRKVLEREELDLCRHCRVHGPFFGGSRVKYPFLSDVTAIWYYEDQVRRSILGYKFYGRRAYAESYGRLLAMKLQDIEFDLITWIPISAKRLRKRGFDQVQLLAEYVGREVGATPVATLQKIHDNPPQSGITGKAERRANVLGVYRVTDPEILKEKKVLLLDDILTTGATAGECARVLLTAGAKEVHCAVIAMARHKK